MMQQHINSLCIKKHRALIDFSLLFNRVKKNSGMCMHSDIIGRNHVAIDTAGNDYGPDRPHA